MSTSILEKMERRLGRRVSVRADATSFVRDNWGQIPQGGGYTTDLAAADLRAAVVHEGELNDQASAIVAAAEEETRDLTVEEAAEFERVMRAHRVASAEVQTIRDRTATLNVPVGIQLSEESLLHARQVGGHHSEPRSTWIDGDGKPVHVLGRGQRLQDLPRAGDKPRLETPHALGHMIRAIASGDWSRCPADVRAEMAGNDNSLGGVLVPSPLGAQVIDYARARSAIWRAGAQTVPMTSDELTIARQIEDPTIELKGENADFTLGDLNFDSIHFTAHKIGAVIVMSRELASDAPNAAEVVSAALAQALAAEIDRLALVGSGSQEPGGLSLVSGVGSTGSVGAITWEDLHAAAVGIKTANHDPNAYILHPTIAGDCDIITSGDGSNSAKLWLGPPPSVAPLERYETTNATTALGFVGDFSKMLIGIRQTALVEVSTEAGDFFKKHQVGIKITFRFDVNTSHPAAFHVLSGITT